MRPQMANSSTSSHHLQNPVHLPTELFFKILKYLSSKTILKASTTDRDWRDVILANPSLFSSIVVIEKGFYEFETDEKLSDPIEQDAGAFKTIDKILRWSKLSNHKVASAILAIETFVKDPSTSLQNWNATKISVVFSILSLSNSLKKLDLSFPIYMEEWGASLELKMMHIATIVKNLKRLESLQEVNISGEVCIHLESGSDTSRKLVIEDGRRAESFGAYYDRLLPSTIPNLIKQVTAYTGRGVTKLLCDNGPSLPPEALIQLEASRENLEEVSLKLDTDSQSPHEPFRFVINCPNLAVLKLDIGQKPEMEDNDDDVEEAEFTFSSERAKASSRLRQIFLQWSGRWRVVLNDDFFNWISGTTALESLELSQADWNEDPSSINLKSLQFLLPSCEASLSRLCLKGISLTSNQALIQSQLQLLKLRHLQLWGSLELVDFMVSNVNFASLETLHLKTYEAGEFNHLKIVQLLKHCRLSLTSVHVSGILPTDASRMESANSDVA